MRCAPLTGIFDEIFQLEHTIPTPDPQFTYCPDSCFLFTEDSLFLLVLVVKEFGSASLDINSTPEFLPSREGYLGAGSHLMVAPSAAGNHEYLMCSLVLVSLRTGEALKGVEVAAIKKRSRTRVCVELSVWLHGYTVALLSPVYQNIFLHMIQADARSSGKWVEICDPISHFLSYTDYVETFLAHPSFTPLPHPAHVFPPSILSQLQQKIFACLYHKYSTCGRMSEAMLSFYRLWEALKKLPIWRVQLLDGGTLFLRYRELHVSSKGTSTYPLSMWVIYCYPEQRVLQVFCDQLDHLSQLLVYCEQKLPAFCQHIRYNMWYSSRSKLVGRGESHSSEDLVRQLMERYPVRLHRMPCYSPYLDRHIYLAHQLLPMTYSSKSMDFDESICFYNARTLNFSFNLDLSLSGSSSRELTLIPHPHDYFIISVERRESTVEFNFHLRFKGNLLWEPTD